MNNLREIDIVLKPTNSHWVGDGFKVSQYLPSQYFDMTRFSPFLLLDYNEPYYFEPGNTPLGVGAHPHRGFETVTLAYEGSVEHHDNKGNHGIINKGDAQWMTAADGIMHKEYHSHEFTKTGGWLHMVQLWVDLPKEFKRTTPKYQPITADQFATIKLDDDAGEIKVLAGEVKGVKGPASTFSPMNVYNVYLNENKAVNLLEPTNYNTQVMVIKGSVTINGELINNGELVAFKHNSEQIEITANEDETIVLVLSGKPLEQPIFAYGPFVMTNEQEIREAFEDFESGKFGPFEF